jgi:hypothetical protein
VKSLALDRHQKSLRTFGEIRLTSGALLFFTIFLDGVAILNKLGPIPKILGACDERYCNM